jgi:glycosyltransferase involved in cell wall biosynthesis
VILEALAAGNCVLVNDHAPNAETVGDAGFYFDSQVGVDDLTERLGDLIDDPDLVHAYRARARKRAARDSWEAVTDQYEKLLRTAHDGRRPGPLPPELIDAGAVAA